MKMVKQLRIIGINPISASYLISSFLHNISYSHLKIPKTITSFDNVNNIEDALHLLDKMLLMRPIPSIVDEALALLHVLEDKGLNSDIKLYNVIIDGTSKHGDFNSAKAFFNGLPSKGLKPDVQTYTVLINGLCLNGQFEEAKEYLVKMGEDGCLPGSVTYNVIAQGFLKGNKCEEVVPILKEMIERGFTPDSSTFQLPSEGQGSTLMDMIHKFAPYKRSSFRY